MKRRKKRIRSPGPIQQRARELRQELTPAEKTFWQQLRNRQLAGFKFRRQHPIDRFIIEKPLPQVVDPKKVLPE